MATAPPKKISLAFSKKPLIKPANGLKRRAAALHDSDDEEDGPVGAHQEISAFDSSAGGAVSSSRPQSTKAPLVIPAVPNHDRLEYGRKRQRSDKPSEQVDIVIPKKQVTYGLLVPEKTTDEPPIGADGVKEVQAVEPKTEDQIALEALTGKGNGNTRTIPLADEDEAFRRDMGDAVEVPTLDQYLAIPPSEFGAACLRGMGWKDTETLGLGGAHENILKPRSTERRPALLGIGAKPSAALGIEIGEWGKAAGRGKKKDETYNPVVLKNKKTGEVITEQELKAKVAKQDQSSTELVFEEKSRRREDEKSRDRDRNRDKGRKPDRHDSDSTRDRDYKSSRSDSRDRSRRRDDDRRDKYEHRDRDHKDRDRDHRRDRDEYSDDRKDRHRDDRYHDGKYISSSRKDRDRAGRDRDSRRR